MKLSLHDRIVVAMNIACYRDPERDDYFNGLVIRQMIYALNDQHPDGRPRT